MTVHRTRTISISIDRLPSDVYAFVRDPTNLPIWAPNVARSVSRDADGAWIVDREDGSVTIAFVDPNPYGVLDHAVTDEQGVQVYVPMRVIANGRGSEVLFTLFEAQLADEALVQADLENLQRILERP